MNTFFRILLLVFSLNSTSQAKLGGGNEGGGNVTPSGKVFDFAEYEDLEAITDIRQLDVFKFKENKTEVTDNTWFQLKKFFEKEYNTAFLGLFIKKAEERKWYFDLSEEGFTGSCINISISEKEKKAVACQDENEVRINKSWWTDAKTTDWQRMGIIMHELFLIHSRGAYRQGAEFTPSQKDASEKAVRAINAKMFAALAASLEKPRNEEKIAKLKTDFTNELTSRTEFFRHISINFIFGLGLDILNSDKLDKYNFWFPELIFLSPSSSWNTQVKFLNTKIILYNENRYRQFFTDLLETYRNYSAQIDQCHREPACLNILLKEFINLRKFSYLVFEPVMIPFILELNDLKLVRQYCPVIESYTDKELYNSRRFSEYYKYSYSGQKTFEVADFTFKELGPQKVTHVCETAELQKAIASGEYAKKLIEEFEFRKNETIRFLTYTSESLIKISGIKDFVP